MKTKTELLALVDRVTAERDAALRQLETFTADRDAEKLMKAKARIQRDVQTAKVADLQERLTAADERADVLIDLLREVYWNGSITDAKCQQVEDILNAALKPAECCTVSAEDQALLDAGDYTPEELFGVGGKPSCPKCAP